jgi:hypothetical protein
MLTAMLVESGQNERRCKISLRNKPRKSSVCGAQNYGDCNDGTLRQRGTARPRSARPENAEITAETTVVSRATNYTTKNSKIKQVSGLTTTGTATTTSPPERIRRTAARSGESPERIERRSRGEQSEVRLELPGAPLLRP